MPLQEGANVLRFYLSSGAAPVTASIWLWSYKSKVLVRERARPSQRESACTRVRASSIWQLRYKSNGYRSSTSECDCV